jgi:hypothetical protein
MRRPEGILQMGTIGFSATELFLEGYSKDFAATATYDSFWRYELKNLADCADEL